MTHEELTSVIQTLDMAEQQRKKAERALLVVKIEVDRLDRSNPINFQARTKAQEQVSSMISQVEKLGEQMMAVSEHLHGWKTNLAAKREVAAWPRKA